MMKSPQIIRHATPSNKAKRYAKTNFTGWQRKSSACREANLLFWLFNENFASLAKASPVDGEPVESNEIF